MKSNILILLERKIRRMVRNELMEADGKYFNPSSESVELSEFTKEITELLQQFRRTKYKVNSQQLISLANYLDVKSKLFKSLSKSH